MRNEKRSKNKDLVQRKLMKNEGGVNYQRNDMIVYVLYKILK